ncbi:PRTRC system protein F [Aromatoleum evansii]|uniref:PRTRC system protein F n=1 Tax=Aromatoleum evansii TaxID=59406 RepID=UPI00145D9A9F|nr:PRTRC system protein F [Aromatoleum evansii]NMG28412.1 PRTRC system protein F [Aromatoleum evansii]
MRSDLAEAGHRLPAVVTGESTHPSRSGIAVDCLSIPRASAVKAAVETLDEADPKYAGLALHLFDLGLLSELDREVASIPQLLGRGLTRWMTHCVGETSQVNRINGRIGLTLDGAMNHDYGNTTVPDDEDPTYLVLWHEENDRILCVGDVMMQLESILPGLGETIYAAIETASYKTVGAFTPNRAFYEAQCLYWQGVETDDDLREEFELNYGESWREEMADEDIFWPSDFRKSFPVAWVLNPSSRVSERKLKKLARRNPLAWVRRLCTLTLTMHQLVRDGALLEGTQEFLDAESVYSSAILRWNTDDCVERVADDFIQRANDSSDCYTDIVSVMEVPIEKEAFLRWQQQVSKGLRLYQLLDAALAVVAEQNQEIENHDRNTSAIRCDDARAVERDRAVCAEEGELVCA